LVRAFAALSSGVAVTVMCGVGAAALSHAPRPSDSICRTTKHSGVALAQQRAENPAPFGLNHGIECLFGYPYFKVEFLLVRCDGRCEA
jgi:hypothetical protein